MIGGLNRPRPQGMGILPLLAAAIPAVVGVVAQRGASKDAKEAAEDQAKAAVRAAEIQARTQRQAIRSTEARSKAAARTALWIGGGVLVLGGLWLLTREKREKSS